MFFYIFVCCCCRNCFGRHFEFCRRTCFACSVNKFYTVKTCPFIKLFSCFCRICLNCYNYIFFIFTIACTAVYCQSICFRHTFSDNYSNRISGIIVFGFFITNIICSRRKVCGFIICTVNGKCKCRVCGIFHFCCCTCNLTVTASYDCRYNTCKTGRCLLCGFVDRPRNCLRVCCIVTPFIAI